MRTGEIVAICTSLKGGAKYQQESARVTKFGLEGDLRDGHITVVAHEVLNYASSELGINLMPGDLGDNLCVKGLGRLAQEPEGSKLCIDGSSVILYVVGQNPSYRGLGKYHKRLARVIHGMRGLVCTVESGVGREIQPGHLVGVQTPAEIARYEASLIAANDPYAAP